MKSRPILFSAHMVQAVLAGAKTQTRRPINPQPVAVRGEVGSLRWGGQHWHPSELARCCRYGHIGDQLYVRETWRTHTGHDGVKPSEIPAGAPIQYLADGDHGLQLAGDTRASIHMPRWASRITLEIADVRVQALQDISDDDAIAEGIEALAVPSWSTAGRRWRNYLGTAAYLDGFERPTSSFATLWDSIHGAGAWDANPFVWALTLKRIPP